MNKQLFKWVAFCFVAICLIVASARIHVYSMHGDAIEIVEVDANSELRRFKTKLDRKYRLRIDYLFSLDSFDGAYPKLVAILSNSDGLENRVEIEHIETHVVDRDKNISKRYIIYDLPYDGLNQEFYGVKLNAPYQVSVSEYRLMEARKRINLAFVVVPLFVFIGLCLVKIVQYRR